MCGKHSTPKFCMICLICCSKQSTGLEFRSASFWRERDYACWCACQFQRTLPSALRGGAWIEKGEGHKGQKKETHDGHEFRRLCGVLRASRPESQNDMAVFVAIAVWTEWLLLVVSKTREQGHARCFLTTRRAYLSTHFFAPKKKKKCAFENTMNTKMGSRRRRSTLCECGSMRSSGGVIIERNSFRSSSAHFS